MEEAWHMAFHCILACEAQLRAVPMGLDNLRIPSDMASESATSSVKEGAAGAEAKWAVGELEWSTLMIVLDRAVGFSGVTLEKIVDILFLQGYHTGYIYREPLIRFFDKH